MAEDDDVAKTTLSYAESSIDHIIMLRDEGYTWMQMLMSYHELSFWAKHRGFCRALSLLGVPLAFILIVVSEKLAGGILWPSYVLSISAFLFYKSWIGGIEYQKWRQARMVVDTTINVGRRAPGC